MTWCSPIKFSFSADFFVLKLFSLSLFACCSQMTHAVNKWTACVPWITVGKKQNEKKELGKCLDFLTLYQSVPWRFITLGHTSTWHPPLSFLMDYVTLTCLVSWTRDILLTLNSCANTGIKVASALRNSSAARLLHGQSSVNTHQLFFRASHNNVG